METFDVDKWMRQRKSQRISKAKSLKNISKFLLKNKYKYIVVHYDGCGDSGESHQAEGYITEESFIKRGLSAQYKPWNHDKKEDFDEWEGMTRNQKDIDKLVKEYNEKNNSDICITDLLTELIDYDWYNNEGGQGQVIFNIKEGYVLVDGEQNTSACYDVLEKYFLDGTNPEYSYDTEGRIKS